MNRCVGSSRSDPNLRSSIGVSTILCGTAKAKGGRRDFATIFDSQIFCGPTFGAICCRKEEARRGTKEEKGRFVFVTEFAFVVSFKIWHFWLTWFLFNVMTEEIRRKEREAEAMKLQGWETNPPPYYSSDFCLLFFWFFASPTLLFLWFFTTPPYYSYDFFLSAQKWPNKGRLRSKRNWMN